MKRRILILFLILAILSLASAGTYAYYITLQPARNVVTTGATLSECARVLLTAGAKEIHCGAVAIARHRANNKVR